MFEQIPKKGLYSHFKKGEYYFLNNLSKDCTRDTIVCHYFNLMSPELGVFTRDLEEWFSDVSEREDNMTGQKTRFERVVDPRFQLDRIPTERLIKELSTRANSPFHGLDDIKELTGNIASVDYVIGVLHEETEENDGGVETLNVFNDIIQAKKHLQERLYPKRSNIYKRTFIKV